MPPAVIGATAPFRDTSGLAPRRVHIPWSFYQGNRLSFSMRCGGEVPLSGHGSVTFSSTSFEGEMDVTANISGIGEVQSKNQISGKRAGDC